jgi:hypothetical protein
LVQPQREKIPDPAEQEHFANPHPEPAVDSTRLEPEAVLTVDRTDCPQIVEIPAQAPENLEAVAVPAKPVLARQTVMGSVLRVSERQRATAFVRPASEYRKAKESAGWFFERPNPAFPNQNRPEAAEVERSTELKTATAEQSPNLRTSAARAGQIPKAAVSQSPAPLPVAMPFPF